MLALGKIWTYTKKFKLIRKIYSSSEFSRGRHILRQIMEIGWEGKLLRYQINSWFMIYELLFDLRLILEVGDNNAKRIIKFGQIV